MENNKTINRIGIHYAYWMRNWNTDFIKIIKHVASLGFTAIDFATSDMMALPKYQQSEIRKVAEDLDIALAFAPATGPDVDISCSDSGIRTQGIEYFKKCIEFTSFMGSNILAGIIYSSWKAQPDTSEMSECFDKSCAINYSIDSLSQILPTADDYNVLYCLEVVNRFENFLLNTAEEGMNFIQNFDNPSVGLLLDTFHMNIEEDSIIDAIKTADKKLFHFHIGECNRKVPNRNSERMPWRQIFETLKEIGYSGTITMEPFVKKGGEVGTAIAVWRDLVTGSNHEMDSDAISGLNFVKSLLVD